MKKVFFLSLAALSLAACTTTSVAPTTPSTVSTPPSASQPATVPETHTHTDSPPSTSEDLQQAVPTTVPESQNLRFSTTKTYSDGFSITMSTPLPFKASSEAVGAGKNNVKLSVTFTNNTGHAFDASHVTLRVISGGIESPEVFDPQQNLVGGWNPNPLISGESRRLDTGFSVADLEDISVTVLPNLDEYNPVIFSSK